ncbi:MAG: methyltransferase, partial [Planctomycetota bacterium]
MIEIRLGSRPQERREERFADGAVTVRSRKGVRAAERGLLDALPRDKEGSALVVNSIEGLAGMVLRALNPGLRVHCHFDDAWDFEAAQRTVDRHPDLAPCLAVAADPPEGPWDLVVLPVEQDDPTDLVRERLRDAVGWLTPTGLLIGSTSNPKDRFLREEIRAVFGPPTIVEGKTRTTGTTYIARAPGEPGNLRGPGARTFTVREEQAELTFVSRPGVFCYGRLDAGSRTLLEHLDVGETRRILDLGCGTG